MTSHNPSWCLPNTVFSTEKSSHWKEGWTGFIPGSYVALQRCSKPTSGYLAPADPPSLEENEGELGHKEGTEQAQ